MDPARRAFYEYHSTLMEPWDGPACADLHRRHPHRRRPRPQRPAPRPLLGHRGRAGRARLRGRRARHRPRDGRPQGPPRAGPDVPRGHRRRPHRRGRRDQGRSSPRSARTRTGCGRTRSPCRTCPSASTSRTPRRRSAVASARSATPRRSSRSCSAPMAAAGAEPLGAMGSDTPVAVLSQRPRLLFDYFTQMFAQVTNPPLDAIREELVTSIGGAIGPEPNLLEDMPEHARKLIARRSRSSTTTSSPRSRTSTATRGWPASSRRSPCAACTGSAGGGAALQERLEEIFAEVDRAVDDGVSFIVLSDRDGDAEPAPRSRRCCWPARCTTTCCASRTRTRVSLVVEAGDVREVHHVAAARRLRRGGREPVPRHGVRRGPGALAATSTSRPRRPSPTSSRRSARACSRS